jgi:hypothetical protein
MVRHPGKELRETAGRLCLRRQHRAELSLSSWAVKEENKLLCNAGCYGSPEIGLYECQCQIDASVTPAEVQPWPSIT